jgi:hypothetical protein
MSKKELSAVSVFEHLKRKAITQAAAGKLLGLTVRHVRRKLDAYRRSGPQSLVHQLRGKPGNRRLDPAVKARALTIIRKRYPDFTPTFAAEKLHEEHRIALHPETLRLWMVDADLWRIGGGSVVPRQWRERRDCVGELVQLDGSDHPWFENRGPRCTLLLFIDDATSRLLHGAFVPDETTKDLLAATRAYLVHEGRPLTLYVDRHSIYRVNVNNAEGDKVTQYARAMQELDIALIHARSPQAKGRVERAFGTLQDRLVKELRLAKISTRDAANRFFRETYLPRHNAKFAVAPKRETNLHRSLRGFDLSFILSVREERTVANDFTVQYQTRLFQLEPKQTTLLRPGDRVTVHAGLDGDLRMTIRKTVLRFQEIGERPRKLASLRERKPRVLWIPPASHPWRTGAAADISILAN